MDFARGTGRASALGGKLKLLAIGASLLFSDVANATLFDRGGGLIYDDQLNITWLQDANYAKTSGFDADGLMQWAAAEAWASGLVYQGYSDWRLPTLNDTSPTTTAYNCPPAFGGTAAGCAARLNYMGYMYSYNLGGLVNITDLRGDQTVGGVTLHNIQFAYWSSTEFGPNDAWAYGFSDGNQGAPAKNVEEAAWAVRTGDSVARVPEPATLTLLGLGLAGLAVSRRRKLN